MDPDDDEVSTTMTAASVSPCQGNCAAPLADIQAAVAGLAERVEALITAVNSIGEITTDHQAKLGTIVAVVNEFQAKFASLSPGQLIKGMMGASRG